MGTIISTKNQKGQGLVTVMIAAALLVVSGLAVSSFLTGYNKQSQRLENSASCMQIASQVSNSFQKDNNNLYITSFGAAAGSMNYAANLDSTADGIDRFDFGGATPAISVSSGKYNMGLADPSLKNWNTLLTPLNATWKYTNYLNIKNSYARLIALAGSGNFCCSSLDPTDLNCGALFYDQNTPRPSLDISQQNVSIDVGVNVTVNNASVCAGSTLPKANLPSTARSSSVDYMVRVFTDRGTANEHVCSVRGRVQSEPDNLAPLTILEYTSPICSSPGLSEPAICSAANPSSTDVTIKVQTLADKTGTSCQTNCLSQVGKTAAAQQCAGMAGNASITNSIDDVAACGLANCISNDPGSFYLCRIGEKNWFDNPANAADWEPCEKTFVHDWDGSNAGTVSIAYSGTANQQKTSAAVITLSGLTAQRSYVADVRAVDTYGNIGPSFCGFSPSCSSAAALPHFAILSSGPTNGALAEVTNMVLPATSSTTATVSSPFSAPVPSVANGRDKTYTSVAAYNGAFSMLDSAPSPYSNYQCVTGASTFAMLSAYSPPNPPAGAYNTFAITCSAKLTTPTGASVVIPATYDNTTTYNGQKGYCVATVPSQATKGPYTLSVSSQNECSQSTSQAEAWCLDNTTPFVPTAKAAPNNFSSPPTAANFSSLVKIPPSKVCGTVTLCPNGNNTGFSPVYGSSCPVPVGWAGGLCAADPLNNYCAKVVDPCGRGVNTNSTSYDTEIACAAAPDNKYCPVLNSCGTSIGSSPATCVPPVNCAGHWGACSKTCGGGSQSFIITTPASGGGMACIYASGSTRACNVMACAGGCDWVATGLGACSGGSQTINYTCEDASNNPCGTCVGSGVPATQACGACSWVQTGLGACVAGSQTINYACKDASNNPCGTCVGSGVPATQACGAPAINGKCGPSGPPASCDQGTVINKTGSLMTGVSWTCQGSNGGTNDTSCSFQGQGPCNSSPPQCPVFGGTYGTGCCCLDNGTSTYMWKCFGNVAFCPATCN